SLALIEYLDEGTPAPPRLLPEDRALRCEARAWAMACEMNFQRPYREVAIGVRGPRETWAVPAIREAMVGITEAAAVLARRLASSGEHLAGEFSIADVAWAPFLLNAREIGLGSIFEQHPSLAAYLDRLAARP